jgi:isovaleryl-CoA dehydrogenase
MNFALTDRQQELTRLYRDIGLRHAREPMRESFDWNAWRAISDAGLWRLAVPQELGGAGGTWLEFAAAFEALASTMRSIGFAMASANQAALIHALVTYGTHEQHGSALARLMAGAPAASAISERGTGTEIRALQTALSEDEHGYRLNGHKYNISIAPIAPIVFVAARLHDGNADGNGVTLAIVDITLPGVTRSSPQPTLGVRDLPVGELDFQNVPIARNALLGAPRDGGKALQRIASMNRACFGLLCADAIQPFLTDALAYAGARTILDVPLDTHQHVQRRLVDIRMRAERSRWMALAALAQLLDGHPAALENCSIAKLSAAHDLTCSAMDLLALHGSNGYRGGAVSTFVADALAMVSAGGTEEMHRRNIFTQMQRRLDGTPRKPVRALQPTSMPA